jgi:hypothetical protein
MTPSANIKKTFGKNLLSLFGKWGRLGNGYGVDLLRFLEREKGRRLWHLDIPPKALARS